MWYTRFKEMLLKLTVSVSSYFFGVTTRKFKCIKPPIIFSPDAAAMKFPPKWPQQSSGNNPQYNQSVFPAEKAMLRIHLTFPDISTWTSHKFLKLSLFKSWFCPLNSPLPSLSHGSQASLQKKKNATKLTLKMKEGAFSRSQGGTSSADTLFEPYKIQSPPKLQENKFMLL